MTATPRAEETAPMAGVPCAKCGTTGGYIPPGQRRPTRCSAIPYGMVGWLCKACWERLYDRRKRPRRRRRPKTPDSRPMAPCAICGTERGRVPKGQTRPGRISGSPFGVAGELCYACYGLCSRKMKAGQFNIEEIRERTASALPVLSLRELYERTARVRAVKRHKEAAGLLPFLSTRELRAALPCEVAS